MKFEIEGLDAFLNALDEAANGQLKEEMSLWLEATGMEFLDLIQDEIIRTKTVDTRRLLNSFGRGDSENIWSIQNGGLSLEVGTNLNYAAYANDGHRQNKRWVPGRWIGSRFEYDPGASTGMMLKEKWIEGSHYWDNAFSIFEKMFDKSLERRLQAWLDTNF
ncbi:HK97 gp10 family phage protein [Bacillus badius]|uniref:Phage portal protein n=1 Tax=Bacillus badius TaxID=1455 RepID=A0ABR5B161_BACBA|nr:HK97 gp10 family phage protein [Bacillus badius]KIL80728.1 hypothetical protein SD77_0576 [Bacillus badius]MED4715343.1 HK97 gp10 family phage protein [Bacillus badius]